ncbi:MAG TPA: alkaline phosphatase family protein, partial [Bradyrhizobium sp.]|nr:alkaline phosphatase family protein [Bradyrhizobium sp.]
IVVNFRTYVAPGCDVPTNCQVQVADTVLRQGQGMHGSFGRGDTMNFMAAIGPDFKAGYADALPVSNADVGATAAKILGLMPKPHGNLIGRAMTEAMPNGATPKATSDTMKSAAAANGLRTVLDFQRVGTQRYFDAAGFPGRTVGLEAEAANGGKEKTAGK